MVLSDREMIERSEAYYGQRTDYLSFNETRELVSLGPSPTDPRPPGTWPVGSAEKNGLVCLLLCPNRYPVHHTDEALRYKIALLQFDFTHSTTDLHQTWKYQKDLLVRYFHRIYDLVPEEVIANHEHVGGVHSKLEERYKYLKNALASVLVNHIAYGWSSVRSKRRRLITVGKLDNNKLIHNMFVRPMVHFLVTEMNPYNELTYEAIMTSDTCKQQDHIIRVAKKEGIWSNGYVMPRAQVSSDHPSCLTVEDIDMCKGIPYDFARLCALVIQNFDYGEDYKLHWTEQEQRDLYKPFDKKYCFPRFPPISTRLKEYGRHYIN